MSAVILTRFQHDLTGGIWQPLWQRPEVSMSCRWHWNVIRHICHVLLSTTMMFRSHSNPILSVRSQAGDSVPINAWLNSAHLNIVDADDMLMVRIGRQPADYRRSCGYVHGPHSAGTELVGVTADYHRAGCIS